MTVRCRNCKVENVRVQSVDEYVGTCDGDLEVVGGRVEFLPGGYTEIDWSSCDQVAWQCRNCFWTVEFLKDEKGAVIEQEQDALARLVQVIVDEGEDSMYEVGDVVYVDGVSAILGDVQVVEQDEDGQQRVTVKWRETVTTEQSEDLVRGKEEA